MSQAQVDLDCLASERSLGSQTVGDVTRGSDRSSYIDEFTAAMTAAGHEHCHQELDDFNLHGCSERLHDQLHVDVEARYAYPDCDPIEAQGPYDGQWNCGNGRDGVDPGADFMVDDDAFGQDMTMHAHGHGPDAFAESRQAGIVIHHNVNVSAAMDRQGVDVQHLACDHVDQETLGNTSERSNENGVSSGPDEIPISANVRHCHNGPRRSFPPDMSSMSDQHCDTPCGNASEVLYLHCSSHSTSRGQTSGSHGQHVHVRDHASHAGGAPHAPRERTRQGHPTAIHGSERPGAASASQFATAHGQRHGRVQQHVHHYSAQETLPVTGHGNLMDHDKQDFSKSRVPPDSTQKRENAGLVTEDCSSTASSLASRARNPSNGQPLASEVALLRERLVRLEQEKLQLEERDSILRRTMEELSAEAQGKEALSERVSQLEAELHEARLSLSDCRSVLKRERELKEAEANASKGLHAQVDALNSQVESMRGIIESVDVSLERVSRPDGTIDATKLVLELARMAMPELQDVSTPQAAVAQLEASLAVDAEHRPPLMPCSASSQQGSPPAATSNSSQHDGRPISASPVPQAAPRGPADARRRTKSPVPARVLASPPPAARSPARGSRQVRAVPPAPALTEFPHRPFVAPTGLPCSASCVAPATTMTTRTTSPGPPVRQSYAAPASPSVISRGGTMLPSSSTMLRGSPVMSAPFRSPNFAFGAHPLEVGLVPPPLGAHVGAFPPQLAPQPTIGTQRRVETAIVIHLDMVLMNDFT